MTKWILLKKREPHEYSKVIMTDGKKVAIISVSTIYDGKGCKLSYDSRYQFPDTEPIAWCMWDDLSTIEVEKEKS